MGLHVTNTAANSENHQIISKINAAKFNYFVCLPLNISKISTSKYSSSDKLGGLLAADLKQSNAVSAVSSNIIMAPALAEPLSPTEKLSSSTATATVTTHTHSTRSSKKVDSVPSTSASLSPVCATPPNASNKEKRNRSASVTPSTSSRVTRSKDAFQRIFEQAVSPTSSITASSPTPSKINANNNAQMGLSAALNNNNNDEATNTENSNTVNLSNNCKDNSTEQLLADLTNDFEEAITAEICLRKQLLDVNLSKSATTTDGGNTSEPKDSIVIKSATAETVSVASPAKDNAQTHMESQTTVAPQQLNELKSQVEPQENSEVDSFDAKKQIKADEFNLESPTRGEIIEKNSEKVGKILNSETLAKIESTPKHEQQLSPQQRNEIHRSPLVSVEELPPISTDSTMTASEVEDNLEERLSQLVGTAVAELSCDEVNAVVSEDADTTMCAVPATPPRTPTQQQQQETHQQQVQLLQQQLQQTPPTPVSQQVQQSRLTPQSTTSSMNTLGSGNMPQSFMKESSGAGELEDQDIEEVLKALKGFDATSGSDTLCDLNVLFNEVYTTLNYEEMTSSQPASSSAVTPNASKPNPLKEIQVEIEREQQTMQRKIDFLVRRMRKMQARYMSKHTSEEISGLFEWSARVACKGGTRIGLETETSAPFISVIAARPPAHTWAEEKKNPVPSAHMCTILRKLETTANAQQLCTSPSSSAGAAWCGPSKLQLRKSKKSEQDTHAVSIASTSALPIERKEDTILPTFDANVAEELTHVAGLLQSEIREVQNAIDSDATVSSSGGESADEMVTYNNQIQQPLSIAKRAAWRYSRDRAAIASRWSWLLSQIADLEIKIRQHSELHQEVVRTKGTVVCGPEVGGATSSVNGYKGDLSSSIGLKDENDAGACRTRGFVSAQFRKRKLFQTTNIHTISKKAARPSTIKCGCQWPLYPCALCTGRSDPTAPRDLPDTMMMPDRVALLDPGFHPVLSFPEDVNNSIHFEAIARLPDWQQRVMRCQVKSIAKSVWKAEREAAAATGHHHSSSKKYGDNSSTTKRRYIKKKDRIAEEKATAAAVATGGTTASSMNDTGNGTGTLSTSSTTPLVANKQTKSSKKLHSHLLGDGIPMEPLSPVPTNSSSHSQSSNSNNYIHQTSDFPQQNCDQFNPNQAHSSLISSKNSKHRKLSTSATNAFYHNSHHHQNNNNNHYSGSNNSHYYNSNGNNEMSFLHTNDNWDCFASRSRTSSPTHGGSSNYHKYERSLDRKNRSSYDIDNIVIPYSVAAATRVEILPYKEIPTPKWRVIEDENQNQNNDSSSKVDTEVVNENTSNNTIALKTEAETRTADVESAVVTTTVPPEDLARDGPSCHTKDVITNKMDDEENIKPKNELDVQIKNKSSADNKKNNNVLNKAVEVKTGRLNESPVMVPKYVEIIKEEISEQPPATKKLKTEIFIIKNNNSCEITDNACLQNLPTNDLNEEERIKKEEYCDEAEDGEEDISNESMILRHERALTEERRKFQTFLKFPWSTRSRANRRADSRAESSGANTPDPTSPAPNTPSVGGGDQESIPSPLAPSTPLNPLDGISETGENASGILFPSLPAASVYNCISKRYERRRTTSTKKERETERRSSTPDFKELIPPYEPLNFPLPDDVFENLMRNMPNDYSQEDDSKIFEDCLLDTSVKSTRSRNSSKTERSSLSAVNCDVNNRKQKINSFIHKVGDEGGGGFVEAATGAGGNLHHYANGQADTDNINDDIDDDDEDDDMVDELDDDYPKHHLAPNDENDDVVYEEVNDSNHGRRDDGYKAYVGRSSMLGDSGGESSETEPFQDDDPNDPEWKGESEERSDRIRRKL